MRIRRGAFRLDFGELVNIDQLVLHTGGDYNMQPIRNHEAVSGWVSADLQNWIPVKGFAEGDLLFTINVDFPVRYFRMNRCPDRINEVRGSYRGESLVRSDWGASNLFAFNFPVDTAWKASVTVDEVHAGSYLVIPVFGPHVPEAVYAAASCEGEFLGAARRAPSYPSNIFEQTVRPGQNYSYFIPLDKKHAGKPIEVYLLGLDSCGKEELSSEVWVTAHPGPHVAKSVVLTKE